MIVNGEKYCGTCRIWLPVSEFHESKDKSDGLMYQCKACRSARNHIYYLRRFPERNGRRVGEDNHKSKITKEIAANIMRQLGNGDMSQYEIARANGCSRDIVAAIHQNRTWKHVRQEVKEGEMW